MDSSLSHHSKVYHVRSVTQGDVIRADAKEIPRIFQLLYAGEGASHRPDEQLDSTMLVSSNEERPGTIIHKGKLHLFTYLPLSLSLTRTLCLSLPLSFRARVRAHHVSHANSLRGLHQAAVATVQAAGGVRMQEVSNG